MPDVQRAVLYVEDEETDVFLMAYAFEGERLQEAFHSVPDGKTAIAYLSGAGRFADRDQYPIPTVVLLDLNMPGISGFDVLAWIREQRPYRSLPVIVFSSSDREEDQTSARRLGATEYWMKPNSSLLFVPLVREIRERWLIVPRSSVPG